MGGFLQRVASVHFDDNNFVGRKRQMDDVVSEVSSLEPKRERKMKVSAGRRERCRINQARYRQRQRDNAHQLNESIQQVQNEIADLESQRQIIIRNVPTNHSVWVVATEYFRLFLHGYMTPILALESPESKPEKNTQRHVQLDFLKTSMAVDVTDGVLCGAEATFENWRLFSMFHGDGNVQVKILQQVEAESLLATMIISLTISKNTRTNCTRTWSARMEYHRLLLRC